MISLSTYSFSIFLGKILSLFLYACVRAKSIQLCPNLCDPKDCDLKVPLSMGFSRQEYWSGLLCPPPGNLPHQGITLASLTSPLWQAGSLPL